MLKNGCLTKLKNKNKIICNKKINVDVSLKKKKKETR